MAAAIWSTPMHKIGEYPVESMLAFLKNHGLLKLIQRPQWRFVNNGSASYVKAILDSSDLIMYLQESHRLSINQIINGTIQHIQS